MYLLNELGKSDTIQGLSSILSLFHNKFNEFTKTGARMLDYFFSYDINITLFRISCV